MCVFLCTNICIPDSSKTKCATTVILSKLVRIMRSWQGNVVSIIRRRKRGVRVFVIPIHAAEMCGCVLPLAATDQERGGERLLLLSLETDGQREQKSEMVTMYCLQSVKASRGKAASTFINLHVYCEHGVKDLINETNVLRYLS